MTPTDTGALTLTTPSDTEVVVARTFDAPRELVWKAYTEPEHITQWMLGPADWTMPVCELELRPGARYRFGWRKDDGQEMIVLNLTARGPLPGSATDFNGVLSGLDLGHVAIVRSFAALIPDADKYWGQKHANG